MNHLKHSPDGVHDVIVVGGGPAGLMACVGAIRAGARTLLIEKGDRLGRKLIISGGGRCNVTNAGDIDHLVTMIPGNGKFMRGAFAQFSNRDIINLFEGLGVRLKQEDNGRMFPVTDKATTVAETLISHLRTAGVTIQLGAPVKQLTQADGAITGLTLQNGETKRAGAIVVAVGGKSVPKTGSTGDGYAWVTSLGHTVTTLYPTEVPILCDADWITDRSAMGLSLRDVALHLFNHKGQRLTTQRGDAIITHFGLSGPAALRLGHYVSCALSRQVAPLRCLIDLQPDWQTSDWDHALINQFNLHPKRTIRNHLSELVPERLVDTLLQLSQLNGDANASHLPKKNHLQLLQCLKGLPLTVTGTRSIEEAFVTGGGISLKEIDPKTMASRLVKGLHFAGEIMDVHAHTGGYNITIAFSSGFVAGTWAAKHALAARWNPTDHPHDN